VTPYSQDDAAKAELRIEALESAIKRAVNGRTSGLSWYEVEDILRWALKEQR